MRKNNKSAYCKGFSLGLFIAIAITIISFYLFPLLIIDTGSGMFFLLLVVPIVCFVSALVYGFFVGFKWFYPIIVAILFVPTIFIYYNSSAFIYIIIYAAFAFIGIGIGGLFHKNRKSA
jgi:O-antigen/teichoic acid export membrane protein